MIAGGLEISALTQRIGMLRREAGLGIIFMLHHVRPHDPQSFDPNALLAITPDFLDSALDRLKALGLRAVDLSEIPGALARNDPSDPVFAVTLDDGYRNNLEHALPVFEKHKVPFTIFVTSGFIERRHTLWWETAERLLRCENELTIDLGEGPERFRAVSHAEKSSIFQALVTVMTGPGQRDAINGLDNAARAAGIEPLDITDALMMTEGELRSLARHPLAGLEPHTVSHPALAHVTIDQLRDEITESVRRLHDWTGRKPRFFAFPYGDPRAAGEREFAAARDAGLSLALTTRPGVLKPHQAATPFALPRASLNGLFQKPRFVDALVSGLPFRFAGLIKKSN